MFKELRGLNVIVEKLSNELQKVVSSKDRQDLLFVCSLFSSPLHFYFCF